MRLFLPTSVSLCLLSHVLVACQPGEIGGTSGGTTTVSDTSGTTTDATGSSDTEGTGEDAGTDGGCPPQIFEGTLTVHNDQQMVALAGVTRVTDNLSITGSVTGLGDLACLEVVDGRLKIHEAPGLESLAGLEQLASVEEVSLEELASLGSLEGFAPDHIDALELRGLPALETLAGIESIRPPKLELIELEVDSLAPLSDMGPTLTNISIRGLPLLESLAGLEGTHAPDLMRIRDTPIRDLSALATVGTLGLMALDNTAIEHLDAFSQVETVRNMIIEGAPALTDASGLDGTVVGGLDLSDCPLLTTAPAVVFEHDEREDMDDSLYVAEMPVLTSLGGMVLPANLLSGISLINAPVLGSINELSVVESIEFLHLENVGTVDLQPFSALTEIEGQIYLANLDASDLSFLSGLAVIGADIFIYDTTLTDVSELHDVEVGAQEVQFGGNLQLRDACIDALEAALIDNGANIFVWHAENNGGEGPCL